jgi:hypothetical protein
VVGILGVAGLGLTGCAPAVGPDEPARTRTGATPESPAATSEGQPPAKAEPTSDPFPGWTTYTNAAFGVSFRYPSTWFGPEVYEFEEGVRLEVGSDVVYPYGTGPEDRQPGAPNAYNVVIQYTLNPSGWTLEQARAEQPWFNETLAVLDLQDGESITTARSLTTRLRGLTVNRFTGVEFSTTLPDTAQTERFHTRAAFLMDENLNVIVISGQPVHVEIADAATWGATFEALDAANEPIFRSLVESIQVK